LKGAATARPIFAPAVPFQHHLNLTPKGTATIILTAGKFGIGTANHQAVALAGL